MAAVIYSAFLSMIFMLQARPITADFKIPFLSPPSGNNFSCTDSVCGKGSCVVSSGSTFGYACECNSGWKQARSNDNDSLKFLPCVVPNCSLDYSCGNAPAPAPANQSISNSSFLDPCFWSYCGGGTCNQTSVFTHTCECEEGYFNLFNSTVFPCYKECTLGLDCAGLGLGPNNSTTSQPRPNTANNSRSHAVSPIPRFKFCWLITMASTLVLIVWNYC